MIPTLLSNLFLVLISVLINKACIELCMFGGTCGSIVQIIRSYEKKSVGEKKGKERGKGGAAAAAEEEDDD